MSTSETDPEPTLSALADEIKLQAAAIDEYIQEHNCPRPSFDRDGPRTFPVPETVSHIQLARYKLMEAAQKLYDLTRSPTESLIHTSFLNVFDCAVLRTVHRFKMADAVPLDGEASYAEIAKTVGLGEEFVTRIIRHAITSRIFKEHRLGYVIHSASSAVLAQDEAVRDVLSHQLEVVYPSATRLADTAEIFPFTSGEANEAAFNLSFDTHADFWGFLAKPENAQYKHNYFAAVRYATRSRTFRPLNVANAPIWDKLETGVVVDVGGSDGYICKEIAKRNRGLSFIIQDKEEVVAQGQEVLEEELKTRMSFMTHDFMKPQLVTADVYILRWILHDYSDKYCRKILKNITLAMKRGSRILIVESLLPSTLPATQQRVIRSVDLQMMVLQNSKERCMEQWEVLISEANERLKIVNFSVPDDSALTMIEVEYI